MVFGRVIGDVKGGIKLGKSPSEGLKDEGQNEGGTAAPITPLPKPSGFISLQDKNRRPQRCARNPIW